MKTTITSILLGLGMVAPINAQTIFCNFDDVKSTSIECLATTINKVANPLKEGYNISDSCLLLVYSGKSLQTKINFSPTKVGKHNALEFLIYSNKKLQVGAGLLSKTGNYIFSSSLITDTSISKPGWRKITLVSKLTNPDSIVAAFHCYITTFYQEEVALDSFYIDEIRAFNFSQYGCQFDNSESIINYLLGKWKWSASCSGFPPSCSNPEKSGYNLSYIFSKIADTQDSLSFTCFKNDTIFKTGIAMISFSKSIYGNCWNLQYVTGLVSSKLTFERCMTDRLVFGDNIYDGGTVSFERDSSFNDVDYLLLKNELRIYPNPCISTIYAVLNNSSAFEKLTIYDLQARIVKVKLNIEGPTDISELSKGIYFIELQKGKVKYRVKFIKE
jgi:hypothetical protein